jgi:NAD(P)-dependent dehydrogenase (short-subunit alcohol dehydrogenase family)
MANTADQLEDHRRDGDLTDRVIVVTGASSGLGAHLTRTLASRGAYVVATARRAEQLERVGAPIDPKRLLTVAGDVTEEGFPAELMRLAVDRFGQLDVLVNNAGSTSQGRAEDETTEAFVRVMGVNLVAVFACAREAFPYLIESGGGSIVNIASALGLVGIGRIPQAAYCASKGGVISLSRELAAQWATRGVRVNCVAPGWFRSEMTGSMFGQRGMDYIRRTIPMQREGQLHEFEAAVAFLAGGASSYVTGQTLSVDGGWTIV